jgi:hypothetical protein
MRLRIKLEEVETGTEETLLVGMVVARRWEVDHSESVGKALDERPPSVLVELAHIAYNRKHGRSLTIEEFEDRFEVDIDSEAAKAAVDVADPSDPATAQP